MRELGAWSKRKDPLTTAEISEIGPAFPVGVEALHRMLEGMKYSDPVAYYAMGDQLAGAVLGLRMMNTITLLRAELADAKAELAARGPT
jgi:hypothetical protein